MDKPENCDCGWGGVHDPDNPKCSANQRQQCPHEKEVGLYATPEGGDLMNVLCITCFRIRTPTEEDIARSKTEQGG